MFDKIELSAATSIICRLLQLLTLAAIGMLIYLGTSVQFDVTQAIRPYQAALSQDQLNLIIYSDFKLDLLGKILVAAELTIIVVLLGAFRVFGRSASRPFNAVKSLRTIRFLGITFLIKAFLDFLVLPAMLYTLTFDNPAGQRAFTLSVNDRQISFFLVGLALIIAANILIYVLRTKTGEPDAREVSDDTVIAVSPSGEAVATEEPSA